MQKQPYVRTEFHQTHWLSLTHRFSCIAYSNLMCTSVYVNDTCQYSMTTLYTAPSMWHSMSLLFEMTIKVYCFNLHVHSLPQGESQSKVLLFTKTQNCIAENLAEGCLRVSSRKLCALVAYLRHSTSALIMPRSSNLRSLWDMVMDTHVRLVLLIQWNPSIVDTLGTWWSVERCILRKHIYLGQYIHTCSKVSLIQRSPYFRLSFKRGSTVCHKECIHSWGRWGH